MYKFPENEEEARELLDRVKKTEGKMLTSDEIDSLGVILVQSEYPGLRDIIALKYSDALNEKAIPFLIEAIKRNIHTHYISTLIYSCSHFDCSDYIPLFVDLIMIKTDISFYESICVIKSSSKITSTEVKLYLINKLKGFLDRIGKEDKFWEDVNMVIDLLETK